MPQDLLANAKTSNTFAQVAARDILNCTKEASSSSIKQDRRNVLRKTAQSNKKQTWTKSKEPPVTPVTCDAKKTEYQGLFQYKTSFLQLSFLVGMTIGHVLSPVKNLNTICIVKCVKEQCLVQSKVYAMSRSIWKQTCLRILRRP